MIAQPPPVVFRPRPPAAMAIWAVFAACLALAIAMVVLANLGMRLSPPSPGALGVVPLVVVVAWLNHVRPLGLDRTGLHIGSADRGYVLPWSNITGVVIVPRALLWPERIRIRITDIRLAPGWWARRRWGVRVLPGPDLELPVGYGQASAEIATEIRHFIDAYG